MEPAPANTRRSLSQFSLWQLLLCVLGLSVFLALATQWRHVGLAVGCFLAAAAIGCWLRRWQLAAAALTALAIFVLTYVAAWVELGHLSEMEANRFGGTMLRLELAQQRIEEYRREMEELPKTLDDLSLLEPPEYLLFDSLADSWGHPLEYTHRGETFELRSLGRDGIAGGEGMDADIYLFSRDANLPLVQFLFESHASIMVFWTALLASLIAGSLWFVANRKAPPSAWWGASVLMTTILTVIVAVFLAWIHIATSNSGH